MGHKHTWGSIEYSAKSFKDVIWHWCRCVECGAWGFKRQPIDDKISPVTYTWQQSDTEIIE